MVAVMRMHGRIESADSVDELKLPMPTIDGDEVRFALGHRANPLSYSATPDVRL